jgi:F1F0 ATPase subunit 2
MNEVNFLIFSFVIGGLCGIIFFGGLWWTINKAIHSRQPALWIASSFFIRIFVTFLGFYLISRDHFERLGLCLIGFLIARRLIVKHFQNNTLSQSKISKDLLIQEINHAS